MAFIRHPKDFFAGLIFIAFGVGAHHASELTA
jgi:hypothetical protein